MYDIERLIARRIERSRQYLTSHVNPVIQRKNIIEIMVLKSAPRTEPKVLEAIERKKTQIDKIKNTVEAEPLYNELDALEWLLPVVRLQNADDIKDNDFA